MPLSACIETEEERTHRLAQFHGQTLAQVTDKIGEPLVRDKSQAIWAYEEIESIRIPQYEYIFGARYFVGYHTRTNRKRCKFTAKLKSDRVVSSTYDGNGCRRYAPKIKTKP